jgi:hypothetical protein
VVPLYNVETRRIVSVGSDSEIFPLNLPLVEIADAATATPLYYPSIKVEVLGKKDAKPLWLIDGSVVCSDPSLLALSSARRKWGETEEYRVLSISCGQKGRSINGSESATYGGLDWLQHDLLGIAMDGSYVSSHLADILGPSFLRIDCDLAPENDDTDELSPQNIEQLRKLGKDLYAKNKGLVAKFFEPPKPKPKEEETLRKSSSKNSLRKVKEEEERKKREEEEAARKKKEEEEAAQKKKEEEERKKREEEEAARKKAAISKVAEETEESEDDEETGESEEEDDHDEKAKTGSSKKGNLSEEDSYESESESESEKAKKTKEKENSKEKEKEKEKKKKKEGDEDDEDDDEGCIIS